MRFKVKNILTFHRTPFTMNFVKKIIFPLFLLINASLFSATYAYVTNIDNGTLSTFDLSTPGSPTLVGMPVMTGGTGPIGIAISAPPPPLKCEKSFTQKTTECLR